MEAELAELDSQRLVLGELDREEAPDRLAAFVRAALVRVLRAVPEAERPDAQAALANRLLEAMSADERLALPPGVLLGITEAPGSALAAPPELPPRPQIALSASDLLVNGTGQPTIGSELKTELLSADRVDLICAFVIWSGVRILRDSLQDVIRRGGNIRVITTTYMGATEPKALKALSELGADLRVAFNAQTTKLHAKSWLLEREGGLTTGFVGSSNLSHTALHDGLEWNVRLAEADAPHLIERIRATFTTHWASEHFEPYDPSSSSDRERLSRALGQDQDRRRGSAVSFASLDVHPYPHQKRMLDALAIERSRHDRHRNLVVAATGTGKTVVAAIDYRNLCQTAGKDLSLLFVAHRGQILDQSRAMFAQVLRDGSFGEVLGDGSEPVVGRHVFAMVQSLTEARIAELDPEAYDVVIVDEFHHAAAPSYARLLSHARPVELLGLTATPERMDGEDVTEWFGGRIAVELRLWEAIDQGFLAPFQYFGVADGTDLSDLEWKRGGYLDRDLTKVFTGDDVRVGKLVGAIDDIVEDPKRMRALGFCVSVEHAEFMARRFNDTGLAAAAMSGATPSAERRSVLGKLARHELQVVFSVDVLGEGVDVPDVDTILLLRPTQSATVFAQQIGRGLRRAVGKRCLTVIDLIGQQRREFRFDKKFAALVDGRNGPVRKQAEASFPLLPSGCEIELDRMSEEIVLESLRDAARLGRWPALVDDLKSLGDVELAEFLSKSDRSPSDLYRGSKNSWTRLRRDARFETAPGGEFEEKLLRAVGRMTHIDDRERIDFYRGLLDAPKPPQASARNEREQRMLLMLHFDLWGVAQGTDSLERSLLLLWKEPAVRAELVELLGVLDDRSESIARPLGLEPRVPISTHGRYTRDEVLAAFGVGTVQKPPQLREGVLYVPDEATDLFFVTLNKAERDYSPTTMYRDYAISPELFHWESQSTLRASAPTAQRYINHTSEGSNVVIFVRDRAKSASGGTQPYTCLGAATYEQHRGERPMAITWRLRTPMPEAEFEVAQAVAA